MISLTYPIPEDKVPFDTKEPSFVLPERVLQVDWKLFAWCVY